MSASNCGGCAATSRRRPPPRRTPLRLRRHPPLQPFRAQKITGASATAPSSDEFQHIARQQLIFGLHLHVAVDDPEKAIASPEGLAPAPRRVPRALRELSLLARRADRPPVEPPDDLLGVAPLGRATALRKLRGLREAPRHARAGRFIPDYTHVRWDVRLHPRLGTVEFASATPSPGSTTPSRSPPTSRRSSRCSANSSTRAVAS